MTNTARQAIRLAAQNQAVGNFACATFAGGGGQAVVTRDLPDSGTDPISNLINVAALEASSDGTTSTSVLNNPSAPTRITLTWNCNGAAAVTNANATSSGSTDPTVSSSDSIRGQIDYSFKLITPLVGSLFAGPDGSPRVRRQRTGGVLMPRPRTGRQGGVTMVEFALVAPLLFIFIFGLVDFSRIIQANTTVAEAARQAARQGR